MLQHGVKKVAQCTVVTKGQQCNIGEKPTVNILYTDIDYVGPPKQNKEHYESRARCTIELYM